MAGEDILGGATQSLFAGIGQISSAIYWIIILVIVAGIIGIIMYILSFKHIVVIRYRINTRKFAIMDKAKQVERQGVPYWKLFKMKKEVTCPPSEALDITRKGKFIAECYWDAGNPEPVWAKDTSGIDKGLLQPFNTQERAIHVNRVTKALMRKKSSLLETIEKLAVPFALVVILIVILIFFEDISKPAKEMGQLNKELMVENEKISAQNARMLEILVGKMDISELRIPQEISSPIVPLEVTS